MDSESRLFKFYAVNKNSISCLVNNYAWYSSPNEFNDPFDTGIINSSFLKSVNFDNEKILCLTKYLDNVLLWSHYADGHRGFCIEFKDYSDAEINILKSKNIYPIDAPNSKLLIVRNAKPVQYKSTEEIKEFVKEIPILENEIREYFTTKSEEEKTKLQAIIHASSFIKHKDWAYENEFRLINTKNNIQHPPGRIVAVYFGMKMTALDKRCIGKILSPNFIECEMFQMYRSSNERKLLFRKFDPKTDLDGIPMKFG